MILMQAVADGLMGGGTTHVVQLIDAVRASLPVEIRLLSQRGSPILAEAERRGIVGHGLDFFRSRSDPRLWLEIARLVRRVRPSLIHAHGARAALPLVHLRGRTPCLYSVHGYHFSAKQGLARRAGLAAERQIARLAATTVFVSPGDQEIARRCRIRPRRAILIPNGIEVGDLPSARAGDGRTLAFLGRLEEQKDPLLLIDILAGLRQRGFRLRVIGDGPLRPAMAERATALGVADQVEFCGALPRRAALETVRDAAVLVLPSRWEGLPLALLEAMAIGVPVVASAVPGNQTLIEDRVSGRLVPQGDVAAYVQAVIQLGEDPGLRQRLVAAAQERVRRSFAWDAVRRRYLDLYCAALQLPLPA